MKTNLWLFFLGGFFLTAKQLNGQSKNNPLTAVLNQIEDTITKKIITNPQEYRCQIIYTQIDRDKNNEPSFKNYHFNVNPDFYFNPASMVKMPLAFLSLEKLNELKIPGVYKYTRMQFDSSYEKQVAMKKDSSSPDGFPSIAHFIKRAFLISENDPYNRMYQFLGQQAANKKLLEKGYTSSRITRQFMGYTE